MSETLETKNNKWWGRFKISIGEIVFLRVGPTTLWIQRLGKEWRIAYFSKRDLFDNSFEVNIPSKEKEIPFKRQMLPICYQYIMIQGDLS